MSLTAKSPQTVAPQLSLALYQPDIPQNTGTILRMAACFALPVAIIEPAGFPVSDRAFRRAGMDYLDSVAVSRHVSWEAFDAWRRGENRRLILATTKAAQPHTTARFVAGDILLFGRETVGVPDEVHQAADLRLRIPMAANLRSLNLAVSAAVLTGEALRQLDAFPIGEA